MKTNNIVINSIMKKYMKYICAVLLLIGTSASAWSVTYQKVTSVSDLKDGDVIIITNNIASNGSGYAMSNSASGNAMGCVSVNASSDKISYTGSDIMVLTVRRNTKATPNLFAFWTGSGYLYDDGTNNHLKVNSGSYSDGMASGSDWCWTIDLSSGSNPNKCMDIKNNKYTSGTNQPRWIQYNSSAFKSTANYVTYANACIYKVSCSSPFGTLSVADGATVTWSGSNITKTVNLTGQNGSGAKTWSFVGSVPSSVATISGSGSSATVTIKSVNGAQSYKLTVKCAIAASGEYCEEEKTIDITVNAQSYTYTYKANGGSGDDQTQTVYHGKSATLKSNSTFTAPSCKQFEEWNTNSGGSGLSYSAGANVTPTGALTLFAIWEELGPYTISTAVSPAASGTATIGGESSKSCACGATGIALVATPASGYYFNNWTKSPNTTAGGAIASANSSSTTYNVGTGNATLTANFLPYLHVTYNANGGSSAPTDANNYIKNANVSISNSIPTNTGYTFRGWATSSANATAGTVAYTRNQSNAFQITANTELWAVWCKTITGESLTVSGTTPTFSYSTGKGSCTFSWGSVTGATAYNLVIRNTTDGADVHSGAVSANSEYTFTNMIPGKTYRATVTASNACTETSGYAEKSIDCPAIAWPGESSDIVVGTPTKTTASVTFTIANATSFTVWLTDGTAGGAEIAGSRSTISANSSGVASKEFTGLTNDHTYYVHAVGKNICENTTVEKQDVSFTTAHQETYDHYQFACVNFTATIPSGNKAYVTSGNGKTILSKNPVRLTITGAIANHYVDIAPSDADISVYFVKEGDPNTYQVVNGSNQLRIGSDGTFAKDIYFAYTPSAAGDGSVTAPTFTVRCDGFEQTFNGDGSLLKVRALPENFAIIAKVGNIWDILPADMGNTNSTQSAAGVRVDDNACPTIAYTEAGDNAFRIWPIDAPGADRFKSMDAGANGSIIRLSMPNNLYSNNALAFGASESSTAIGAFNNATLTASDATAGSHFYWDITTTEETVGGNTYFKYSLKNPVAKKFLTLSGKNWGMYASGVQEVRFVKIEETKDAELTAMEWAPSQVALRYPGTGTLELTSASVDGAALGSAHMERLGTSDLYILSDVTLQTNPSKALQIVVEEDVSGVKTSKESQIMIPFIIPDGQTKNNSDLRTLVGDNTTNAIIRYVDVVVRKGGKFETDATTKAMFNDLYIYPGGKFEIGGSNNNVSIQNVYLRGGFSWLSNDFGLPQMLIADGKAVEGIGASGNGVFYDLNLNSNIYYMMALPKDVALDAVTNEEGGDDWTAWVKGYSGKPRSLNPQNRGWSLVSGPNLERGKGYEIAIQPRLGRPYGTLRFPLQTTAWSNETACTPAVVAWGMTEGYLNDGVTANNAGWNFIGNPFFTAYNNTVGEKSIIIADSLKKELDDKGNWTGKYVWFGERVKFFTIPSYTTEDYKDVRSTPYKLDAFYPFFVQVNSGTEASPASLTFGTENRSLKMPKRYSISAQQREIMIDFTLSDDNDNSDVAGLDISNEYSSGFDSDDKEKTILGGEKYMKVYTIVGDYRVAFNSLPEESAAKPIPVGVITPEAGYYTFSLLDGLDVSEVDHIWLYDYEKTMQTDLLVDDYRFYGTQGQLDDRFAISVILKADEDPGISTQMDDAMIESSHDQPQKFIYQGHLYILYHDVIFDATGKKVSEINK